MINGVNSNTETQYTIQKLGIKEGSEEASIFKKIDLSDGKEDGFLTQQQYEQYNTDIQTMLDQKRQQAQGVRKKNSFGIDNESGIKKSNIQTFENADGIIEINGEKIENVSCIKYDAQGNIERVDFLGQGRRNKFSYKYQNGIKIAERNELDGGTEVDYCVSNNGYSIDDPNRGETKEFAVRVNPETGERKRGHWMAIYDPVNKQGHNGVPRERNPIGDAEMDIDKYWFD